MPLSLFAVCTSEFPKLQNVLCMDEVLVIDFIPDMKKLINPAL